MHFKSLSLISRSSIVLKWFDFKMGHQDNDPRDDHQGDLPWWKIPLVLLTHWGRATHICVSKLTIIASDNGLAPSRRQTILWTNVGILLIGPFWTNFSEILIEIRIFSFKKCIWKCRLGWRPFCLDLNVLREWSNHVFWSHQFPRYLLLRFILTNLRSRPPMVQISIPSDFALVM